MAWLKGCTAETAASLEANVKDGVLFARAAVEFAALGLEAEGCRMLPTAFHLYAIATELALKSLCLRLGSDVEECKKASHSSAKMLKLVSDRGGRMDSSLANRIGENRILDRLFDFRYPTNFDSALADENLLIPMGLADAVAQILEIKCDWPLEFSGGSAHVEIHGYIAARRTPGHRPVRA